MEELLKDGIGFENGSVSAVNLVKVGNHFGYVSENFIYFFGN